MKTSLPILIGWTLAIWVAPDDASTSTAMQAGVGSLLLPLFVWLGVWLERREQRALLATCVKLADCECVGCYWNQIGLEASRDVENTLLRLRPWCVAFAAVVPLLVLWRLGGAE